MDRRISATRLTGILLAAVTVALLAGPPPAPAHGGDGPLEGRQLGCLALAAKAPTPTRRRSATAACRQAIASGAQRRRACRSARRTRQARTRQRCVRARAAAAAPVYMPFAAGTRITVSQGPNEGGHASGPYAEYRRYGVDFPAANGTPTIASSPGTIVFAGWDDTGWGYTVVKTVDGGADLCERYAHLSAIRQSSGRVLQGDRVGDVGSTGNSTGAHLHHQLQRCSDAISVSFGYADIGTPRGGQTVTSGNRPQGFAFDNLRIYASPELSVTAGSTVRFAIVLRYLGATERDCLNIRLGRRSDADIPFADPSPGFFPNGSWYVTRGRVVVAGCNGTLKPMQDATFYVDVRPPDTHPGGVVSLGSDYAVVDEHREWSTGPTFELRLRIGRAYSASWAGQDTRRLLGLGESAPARMCWRNDGAVAWDLDRVHAATGRTASDTDAPMPLAGAGVTGNRNRIALTDAGGDGEAAVGEVACANWTMQAPADRATAGRAYLHLVVEDPGGLHFAYEVGAYVPYVVADETHFPPELTVADCSNVVWRAQGGSPLTADGWILATSAQPARAFLELENRNELCPLFAEGVRPFRLATSRPTDRGSGFAAPGDGWIASNRIRQTGRVTEPGGVARFDFALRPAAWVPAGDYREYLHGVIDFMAHLQPSIDQGIYLPVRRR